MSTPRRRLGLARAVSTRQQRAVATPVLPPTMLLGRYGAARTGFGRQMRKGSDNLSYRMVYELAWLPEAPYMILLCLCLNVAQPNINPVASHSPTRGADHLRPTCRPTRTQIFSTSFLICPLCKRVNPCFRLPLLSTSQAREERSGEQTPQNLTI